MMQSVIFQGVPFKNILMQKFYKFYKFQNDRYLENHRSQICCTDRTFDFEGFMKKVCSIFITILYSNKLIYIEQNQPGTR